MPPRRERKTAPAAGVVLGMGLVALADGIVLHMLLEWHHMVSSVHPPTTLAAMHVNTYWDGWFHTGAWLAVVLGVALLWRAAQRGDAVPATRAFVGYVLIGVGAFNLAEGLVDHHLLRLHHVREIANPLLYDVAFLVVGGVLPLALGWAMRRRRGPRYR
jgi:uncharacterized membrane protein